MTVSLLIMLAGAVAAWCVSLSIGLVLADTSARAVALRHLAVSFAAALAAHREYERQQEAAFQV